MIESEYHQVVDGTFIPPSQERWDEIRDWTPRLNTIVKRGVELLYQTINLSPSERPDDWECLDDWVERMLHPDSIRYPEHFAAATSLRRHRDRLVYHTLSLCVDVAKTSTLYWGINDPTVEGWCSYCKKPRPIDTFKSSRFTCEDCFDRRRA